MVLIPRHIRRNLCKRNSEIRVYAANEVFPSTTLNPSVFYLFAAFFTISISVWLLRKYYTKRIEKKNIYNNQERKRKEYVYMCVCQYCACVGIINVTHS